MADIPVACSLTGAELQAQREVLLPGLAVLSVGRQWSSNGLVLEFDATTDALARIVQVVDRERQCCQFLDFRLDVPRALGRLRLEITGGPGTREVLENLVTVEHRPS